MIVQDFIVIAFGIFALSLLVFFVAVGLKSIHRSYIPTEPENRPMAEERALRVPDGLPTWLNAFIESRGKDLKTIKKVRMRTFAVFDLLSKDPDSLIFPQSPVEYIVEFEHGPCYMIDVREL